MPDALHVVPVNDHIIHDTDTDDCICGPTAKPVERDDGRIGWMQVLPNLPRRNGPDPRDCACNPERGGSGICGCIRFSGVRC